jgi:uncharacterized Zn finger protein
MIDEEVKKRQKGKCVDCSGPLELYELNVRKGTKVLRCQKCGLFHHYKKNILGWNLIRAAKAEQSSSAR